MGYNEALAGDIVLEKETVEGISKKPCISKHGVFIEMKLTYWRYCRVDMKAGEQGQTTGGGRW